MVRKPPPIDPVAARTLEQRVVDICHVLDVTDAHAGSLDETHQHVERAEGEGVAHVP